MSEHIIGIDLGTTNSEVAYLRDGRPEVIPGEDGDPILPSFVGVADDGRLLVGKAARNQYAAFPERTVKSIKRQMGQDVRVSLGAEDYSPPEVSAMILRALKDRAERHLGAPVRKAVITVPAFFDDAQRQATIEAGAIAGLEVVRIINEPTAAALTYDPNLAARARVLVYDLGGGTFDVSIVSVEAGVVEVLASHGDTRLGGDDFDDLLAGLLAERFLAKHQVDPRGDRLASARLLRAAEAAKRHLSDHPFVRVEEEFIAERDGVPLHLDEEVTRDSYEELILPKLETTIDCLQRSLDDARLTAREIDRVVLVGGSTRTPLVGEMLRDQCGQEPRREIDPDLCVALGAAIQGGIIAGEPVGAVLVDITPHSVGIKALAEPGDFFRPAEFTFAKIIRRNTPLPATRSEVFYTLKDNQDEVKIELYQGEDPDPERNTPLGQFKVTNLAPVPAGNPIVVQLELTLDGVLKATAREKSTGTQKQIVVERAVARLGEAQRGVAQRRVGDLFGDGSRQAEAIPSAAAPPDMPALDAAPREGQREQVQAKALLEKVNRLFDRASADDQLELTRLGDRTRAAMQDRDWPAVSALCDELSDLLFYLDDA